MKYIMKQKFFSLKHDFYIKDANERDVYHVEGEFFSVGLKCKLYDMQHQLKYSIREKLFTILSDYYIYDAQGEEYAVVNQEFAFFKTKFNVTSRVGNINIVGNFIDRNYEIYVNDSLAAVITRKFFSMTDTYTVDVVYEDQAFMLCLICIIDNLIDKRQSN